MTAINKKEVKLVFFFHLQVLINFFDNVLVVVSAVINSACQFLW